MADSINVFDPGWQAPVNPATQLPYADVILNFFDANTTNPRTVYSDFALATSLGQSVSCNALGFPITSGNAKTLVYISSAPYRVQATSVTFGGTLFDFVNVRGALDTSSFLTSAIAADEVIVHVSSNRAITAADKGKLINVNCTAGALTMTLQDAAILGSGFWCTIRHNGTANQVKIVGDGTDAFSLSGVNTTSFSLTGLGQSIKIICDGTSFTTTAVSPALINNTTGVIVIADRPTAPPGSPLPGARYIVQATHTGAWTSFSPSDIAEADGFGAWFRYTPASDCGWIAYVQNENRYYSFQDVAWILGLEPDASDTVKGLAQIALAADMETATSTVLVVPPGRQDRHPRHPKAFAVYNQATPGVIRSSNVSSITNDATGQYTVNFTTAFSAADYGAQGLSIDNGSSSFVVTRRNAGTFTASACQFTVQTGGGTNTSMAYSATVFEGDQ